MVRTHIPTEEAELSDILDRVLDKGLVFDASVRLILGGPEISELLKRISVTIEDQAPPGNMGVVPHRES